MFSDKGPLCGFAMCVPPSSDSEMGAGGQLGITVFMFVWCSGWNLGCSTFVVASVMNLLTKRTKGALCQMGITMLLPHIWIGLFIGLLMGGILWEAIAIWPYYLRIFQVLKKWQSLSTSTPPAVVTETEETVLGNIVRMHSAGELKRNISGPTVVQAVVVQQLTTPENNSASACPEQGVVLGEVIGVDATDNPNLEENPNIQ